MHLARAARAAQQFAGAVGNDLICVHIGRGAGAGLKYIEHKVTVEFAVNHFLRCLHDRFGDLWVDGSQGCVCLGCGLLDLSQGTYKLAWEAQVTDRKIQYGALSTGAVVGIFRYVHLAHRVPLDARFPCPVHKKKPPHKDVCYCLFTGSLYHCGSKPGSRKGPPQHHSAPCHYILSFPAPGLWWNRPVTRIMRVRDIINAILCQKKTRWTGNRMHKMPSRNLS